MNGIRQNYSLSIDLLTVRSGPNIFMRHHLMRNWMHFSWFCRKIDLPLRLKIWLWLRGRYWSFSTMRDSCLCLWVQAQHRLLCIFRRPESSYYTSKRNSRVFSSPSNPLERGDQAYKFHFGLHFFPCGRASCTTQTYFLWSQFFDVWFFWGAIW